MPLTSKWMTLTEWNTLLSHVGDFAEGIPLAPFLLLTNEKKREYKLLGLYFFLGFILKVTSFIIATNGVETLFIYHPLAIIEFSLLFLFFTEHTLYRSWRIVILLIIVLANVASSAMPGALHQFNSLSWSINTFLLLCACIYSFYSLYTRSYESWGEVKSRFLIVSGLLIYLSGCLFTYILASQILSKHLQGFFANGWIINSISNLSKDFIITVALLLSRSK